MNVPKTLRALHEANKRGMERALRSVPQDELQKAVSDFANQHNARVRAWERLNDEANQFSDHVLSLAISDVHEKTNRAELGWTGYYRMQSIAFFKENPGLGGEAINPVDEEMEAKADLIRKYGD